MSGSRSRDWSPALVSAVWHLASGIQLPFWGLEFGLRYSVWYLPSGVWSLVLGSRFRIHLWVLVSGIHDWGHLLAWGPKAELSTHGGHAGRAGVGI